jgi:hypothetical protein
MRTVAWKNRTSARTVLALAAGFALGCSNSVETSVVAQGGSGGAGASAGTAGGAGDASVDGSACTAGSRQCDGLVPQTCDSSGNWQNEASCAYACVGKGECTGVCAPGAKQCSGKVKQTCGADGQWSDTFVCPVACTAGECSTGCADGDKRCSGLVPELCSAQGTWQASAACPYVCQSGSCAGFCVPGSRQCNGLVPQTCDSLGAWQNAAACPLACVAGDCGPCTPGRKRCNGRVAQTCDAGGAWQDSKQCQYVCTEGTCAGVCTPGSKQCNDLVSQTCDDQGAWQKGSACPYVCSAGNCTGVCTPTHKQCNGRVPQTCDGQGAWQDSTVCPYVCSAGNCAGECTPTSKQCNGLVPQTCDETGVWQNGSACPDGCSGGKCTTWCQSAGYGYRKQITLAGSTAGVQTNYQLKLTVNKGAGTDSDATVYLNNHAANWSAAVPNDLVFVRSDGATKLDYWVEGSDANTGTVWIEFDSIPASPAVASFYMCYGNPTASSLSNGANTFDVFSGFESGAAEGVSVFESGGTCAGPFSSVASSTFNSWFNTTMSCGAYIKTGRPISLSGNYTCGARANPYVQNCLRTPTFYCGTASVALTCSAWSTKEVDATNPSGNIYTYLPIGFCGCGLCDCGSSQELDFFYVRKRTSPNPTWGTWGIEETL